MLESNRSREDNATVKLSEKSWNDKTSDLFAVLEDWIVSEDPAKVTDSELTEGKLRYDKTDFERILEEGRYDEGKKFVVCEIAKDNNEEFESVAENESKGDNFEIVLKANVTHNGVLEEYSNVSLYELIKWDTVSSNVLVALK